MHRRTKSLPSLSLAWVMEADLTVDMYHPRLCPGVFSMSVDFAGKAFGMLGVEDVKSRSVLEHGNLRAC